MKGTDHMQNKKQWRRSVWMWLSLLLLTGVQASAQVGTRAVDPGDQPPLPGNKVVEVGSNYYLTLEEAIKANNSTNFTAKLATGITLSGIQEFTNGATINLNKQKLTCYSGTELVIPGGKKLFIKDGNLVGSFAFSGGLMAGADVVLSGTGVYAKGTTESLYRVLVTLPDNAGTLETLKYGDNPINYSTRKDNLLCCWIPQSQIARKITFAYTPSAQSKATYATEALNVTTHGAQPLTVSVNTDDSPYKAEATPSGSSTTQYKTVSEALKAVKDAGGTVKLLATAPLTEAIVVSRSVQINADGFFLQVSGSAAITTSGSGVVEIQGGAIAGNMVIGENVTMPVSLSMAGCAVVKGGKQVYRVRLLLPSGTSTAAYVYGSDSGTLTVRNEEGSQVAYLWLPAHAVPAEFTVTPSGGSPVSRVNVVVEANHDNRIDLTSRDIKAVVYNGNTVVEEYADFLEALVSVKDKDGYRVQLRSNVKLDGAKAYPLDAKMKDTIDFNGYQLIGGTGWLKATDGAVYILKDQTGQGGLSGTLLFDGEIYAGRDIPAGRIGVMKRKSTSTSTSTSTNEQVFRLLVSIDGEITDGFYPYKLGANSGSFYVQNKQACLWASQTTTPEKLSVTADAIIYQGDATVTPAHTNAVTVRKPDVVASVDGTNYDKLSDAIAVALRTSKPVLFHVDIPWTGTLNVEDGKILQVDLNGHQLSAGRNSIWKTTGTGRLRITCRGGTGSLSGNPTIEGNVVADQTVNLSDLYVLSNGNPVYRTRFMLPLSVTDKTLTYSYGSTTGTADTLSSTENGSTVKSAYVWLAGNAKPTTLTVTLASETKVKNNVVILTNHYNRIDMTESDKAVILYPDNSSGGIPFNTLHDALEAVENTYPNSTLVLQADAGLSGSTEHYHNAGLTSVVTIELNGHTLTGGNCWLQATDNSAFVITDQVGTGAISGTFRCKGNIYLDGKIPASKIGQVLRDGSDGQYFRAQVTIVEPDVSVNDGFADYSFGSGASVSCYFRNKIACVFLPSSEQAETLLLTVGGKSYSAPGVTIVASHSNVATVRLPKKVARIGVNEYETLGEALTAAKSMSGPLTIDLLAPAALDKTVEVNGKEWVIDLHEYALTQTSGSGWKVTNNGRVYLKSTEGKGVLAGDFTIDGGAFCVGRGVSITGTVMQNNNPVYRCRFFLTSGTTAATYELGDPASQSGDLFITTETNRSQVVGYAFLKPSGTAKLKVIMTISPSTSTKELSGVSVQAFHNNQFDMESGDNPVYVEGDQYYGSFPLALDAVNTTGSGTIILKQPLSLDKIQSVRSDLTVRLGGFTLALDITAAFDVASDKKMIITDNDPASAGNVYGTLLVKGLVYVSPNIRIAGTVIRDGVEVYRSLVEGLPAGVTSIDYESDGKTQTSPVVDGVACLWLLPVTVEHELLVKAGSSDYEITLQPALPNHNTRLKAYPVVVVNGKADWNDNTYEGYNVNLKNGTKLTIGANGPKALHRVTMENNSEIVCSSAVLATAGITYRHTFTRANTWEAFSLPYHARMARSVCNTGIKGVRPYQLDGTGGDYWLKTIAPDGSFNYVAEEQIVANIGYIIAVPRELTNLDDNSMTIDFVSPTEQYLNRKPALLPTPELGMFVQTAPGTLCQFKLERPFYKLNDDGTQYNRVDASAAVPAYMPPFSSFLLSDPQTTAANASLRLSGLPTSVDTPLMPAMPLRVYGMTGGLRVESDRETTLRIYSLSGQPIYLMPLTAGTTFVSLPAGIYIVNYEKVVVR